MISSQVVGENNNSNKLLLTAGEFKKYYMNHENVAIEMMVFML